MIYDLCMEEDLIKLDSLIVKQAVRDVASKNLETSLKAVSYFKSNDFSELCNRNKIDMKAVAESVKEMVNYPLISRKKLANDIAKLIDNSFVKGVLSK